MVKNKREMLLTEKFINIWMILILETNNIAYI